MELRPPPVTRADRASKPGWLAAIVALQIALMGLVGWSLFRGNSSTNQADPDRLREVASKLRGAGVMEEAAGLYENYLQFETVEPQTRANIAYSLGQMYLDEGRYEPALRWFYESETLGGPKDSGDLQSKIVHALERLGRVHAAQAVLSSSTRLEDPTQPPQRPADDAVVAKIGNQNIYRSEVQRALDDLPPPLAEKFSGVAAKREFLRKYVADEMLWRKAQKLEYGDDPEVRRQLDALYKQLVVGRFIDKEVIGKISVAEEDLVAFFEASKPRYTPKAEEGKPAPEAPEFTAVRPQVERDYRMMKMQVEYQRVIAEQLGASGVELFEEALQP